MVFYKLIILSLIAISTSIRINPKKGINSPPKTWYNIWKIRAGLPGTLILDSAERHGILRGYKPQIAEDPKATGINSYVKDLIQNDYNLNYN
jgi:hypothetical protein